MHYSYPIAFLIFYFLNTFALLVSSVLLLLLSVLVLLFFLLLLYFSTILVFFCHVSRHYQKSKLKLKCFKWNTQITTEFSPSWASLRERERERDDLWGRFCVVYLDMDYYWRVGPCIYNFHKQVAKVLYCLYRAY